MIGIFLLDGVINNYIMIDVILIYFYFYNNKYPFIIGLCYDIIYTGTLFLHAFLFTLVSYLITKIKKLNINYFILLLIMYHIIYYLILVLMKVHIFSYGDILSLIRVIKINTIVVYVIHFIHKKIKHA